MTEVDQLHPLGGRETSLPGVVGIACELVSAAQTLPLSAARGSVAVFPASAQ
jgi:hypothetical protein